MTTPMPPAVAPPGFLSPAAFPFPSGPFPLPNDALTPGLPYLIGSIFVATASVTLPLETGSNPGDTIVVFGAGFSASNAPLTCTDTEGNSYSLTKTDIGNGVRTAQFTAVNPAPLKPGDSVTVTWAGSDIHFVQAIGLPGAAVGAPAGNLIPDGTVSTNISSGTTLTTVLGSGAQSSAVEVAVAWAGAYPLSTAVGVNWPPDWTVLISANRGTGTVSSNDAVSSVAYKVLTRKTTLRPSFLFPGAPSSAGLIISTYMLETRFAPNRPAPDMPPGMQSPGAWQYSPLSSPEGPWSTKYSSSPYKFTEALPAISVSHPAVTRSAAKKAPATTHPAGTLGKGASKGLAATTHPAAVLVRSARKLIAATAHAAGVLKKAAAITRAATPHPAGKLLKSAAKPLTAATHPSAALLKSAAKRLAAATHPAAAMIRAAAKRLAATAHPAAAMIRSRGKTLAATVSVKAKVLVTIPSIIFKLGEAAVRWITGSIGKS